MAIKPGLPEEFDVRVKETLNKFREDVSKGVNPIHVDYGSITNPPPSLVGTGASVFLDQNHANSVTPDTRNIMSMSPEATILIKKKAFSSLKSANDLRYMDKTEKMLLWATKALFAYKVQQIRAYESLTKFENFLADNNMYSMNLLSSFINEGSLFDVDKLSYTSGEYVAKRLQEWYAELKGTMQTDDGSYAYFDTSTGQFIYVTQEQMAESRSSVGPPSFDGSGNQRTTDVFLGETDDGTKASLSIPLLTNKQYLDTLPASTAKQIIEGKKAEFEKEYNGTDGHASALNEAESDLSFSWDSFFSDVGDAFAYGASALQYSAMNEDIAKVLKRNAFSADNQLTTWIVDPHDPANYIVGAGTGVIELTIFNSFNTSTNYEAAPSGASFNVTYPYRLGTILEDDIELAIEEALNGTVGILDELVNGGLRSEGMSGSMPPIDGSSIVSAALELGGAGSADSSLDTDYIRERLRTFYLGKPIVSPPDPVHFYIRGNRTFTDYTLGGASGPEEASEAPFNTEFMEIDNAILKGEYQLYTNQQMGIENYKELRKRQDNSLGMIHVFGGYVANVQESFSQGFWTLNASCTDNMSWLKWSRFAITPALSDPQGILEDPLTPFELAKDELGEVIGSERELLYENKNLLESGLLSYDSGILAGQNATEGNLLQGQYNGVGSLDGKKVLQHPDGFIYRWKTGIITATAGFQVVDPTGESQNSVQFDQRYSVTATNDVLNNLDIPNILSILIVGQPYNVETFIEQSLAAHNKNNKSMSFGPEDPLTGVVEAVRKQNEYFGNFHPYRMLTVSASTAEQMINQAGIREMANNQVKKLQKRKVKLRDKIRSLQKSAGSGASTGIPIAALVATLQAEIDTIDSSIQEQIRVGTQFSNALTSSDEVGIELSLFGPSSGLPESGDEEENHDINRAMMLVGAQRRIEDVRLNRDRNLFVVSDQYDSADIRPFILALHDGKYPLFAGKFVDVFQKCNTAAGYLNLEFFCNTQGHLEFRPPQWNRTPLSVLKEVIRTQEDTGNAIMPAFITNLFQTRIEGLYLSVHTLNVKLVLLALMMGRYPDHTIIPNMKVSGPDSLEFFGIEAPVAGGVFGEIGNFFGGNSPQTGSLQLKQREFQSTAGSITESNNSLFGEGLRVTAAFQENGDILDGDTETLLGTFDPIFQEETGIVNDILTAAGSSGAGNSIKPPAQHLASITNLNNIRDTFKKQFGRDPGQGIGIDKKEGFQAKDLVFFMDENDVDKAVIGNNGILDKIKKAISMRDSYVSMLQANLSKQEELEEIAGILESGEDSDDIEVADGLISGSGVDFLENLAESTQNAIDIITGDANEGTVYDHLIEDDSRNLLGYGSGKRYILKDEYIIQASFSESPPAFVRVDVKGDAPLGMGGKLDSGTDGRYFWAGATDFDLWRQYGYMSTEISVPFISDTEGQARPYAILELILQKMNVNKGSVTMVGNEFYQPGDTVYIPCKGLLYYVKGIGHSFSYSGQSFTTTLELIYGHPPGEYIPSPLDIIGQDLVSNFLEDPAIIYRTDSSDDSYRVLKPDSTLVFPSGGAGMAELLDYNDNQIRFTNMMMDMSGSLTGNKYVLVRGFVKNSDDTEAIQNVSEKMAIVRSLLENPSQVAQNHAYSGGDDLVDGVSQALTSVGSMFGGSSTGTTKELTGMKLPNNMPVFPIKSTKIIEQISYLEREEDTNPLGEIKCMDRKLLGVFTSDLSGDISSSKSLGIFPKGGPKQGSWLDFRDEISGFNFVGEINIIEVGIVDIPNSVLS